MMIPIVITYGVMVETFEPREHPDIQGYIGDIYLIDIITQYNAKVNTFRQYLIFSMFFTIRVCALPPHCVNYPYCRSLAKGRQSRTAVRQTRRGIALCVGYCRYEPCQPRPDERKSRPLKDCGVKPLSSMAVGLYVFFILFGVIIS